MDFQKHYEYQIRLREADTELHKKIIEYKENVIVELSTLHRYQTNPRNRRINLKDLSILETVFKSNDPFSTREIINQTEVTENELAYCYAKTSALGYLNKANSFSR